MWIWPFAWTRLRTLHVANRENTLFGRPTAQNRLKKCQYRVSMFAVFSIAFHWPRTEYRNPVTNPQKWCYIRNTKVLSLNATQSPCKGSDELLCSFISCADVQRLTYNCISRSQIHWMNEKSTRSVSERLPWRTVSIYIASQRIFLR
jgi:hypothetical protein